MAHTVTGTIDRIREQARALYKQIDGSTSNNHGAILGDLKSLGAESILLAASIKQLAKDQRTDARDHLDNAASRLQAAGKPGNSIADVRESLRDALQSISQAVAEVRRG